MSRKSSTLLSLGISMALIAAAIWFLYSHLGSFGYTDGRWRPMPHHIMFGGNTMGLIMILFWAVVIAAVAFIVSGVVSGKRAATSEGELPSSNALEILKRRYANGEIDKSQYETMKKDLA